MNNEQLLTNSKELLKEYDKETGGAREPKGFLRTVVTIICILMSLFHMYTATFGTLLALRQRALHIVFGFMLAFLLYPANKNKKDKMTIVDYLFLAITLAVFGYTFINYEAVLYRGMIMAPHEMILGALSIVLVLEATRRVVGPELPIVAVLFILYALLGPHLPGVLAHSGFSIGRVIHHVYLTHEGIFGIPIGVSSTFVFMFVLFGAFLDKTGVGQFFIDIAYALTGSLRSGPAMTAVVASGLMGSISGSSCANVVTTGTFTIPLMKRVGYKPYFAGAVEATASTGGQIMPPVMGAAAFVMAEFTGIPYLKIVIAAIIPAILYYFAVGAMVHLEACKMGIEGVPRDQLPPVTGLIKRIYLFLPIITIIYFLVKGFTPMHAAVYAIMIAVLTVTVANLINRDKSFTFKHILEALEDGARTPLALYVRVLVAGLVVGVITLTGLGQRLADLIVSLAGGMLLPTLFFTMVASLILGMGLPTTAKYIVLSSMAVPAITSLGVNLMAAHLFILYFGVVADITPPIAVAAYAGAGIAGANSMKTGLQAVKLASAAFIVPYIFAINSDLILVKEMVGTEIIYPNFTETILVILSALIGIICLAAALENFLVDKCNVIERISLFIAAISLLIPGLTSDIIGLVVLFLVYLFQKRRNRTSKPLSEASQA